MHGVPTNSSVTFSTCPYPIGDSPKRKIQYFFSMSSWLLTSPYAKILIHMPQHIFDPGSVLVPLLTSLFGENRLIFGPLLQTDEKGIPYIDDWFLQGMDLSDTDLVCLMNTDIILPKGWMPRIDFLRQKFQAQNRQFAAISRRCDFFLDESFALDFMQSIEKHPVLTDYSFLNNLNVDPVGKWPINFDKVAENRTLHTPWGMDVFLISKSPMELNFDEIPPFHMGRYRWDTWIVGWLRAHVPLATMGDEFCNYHMNHVPTDRSVSKPKVKENLEYAARANLYLGSNDAAEYRFSGRRLVRENGESEDIPDSIPTGNAPPPTPEP
jgi:hypothetical protein